MALASYADLQAAIGTWNVNRTDLPTADLITLAEARLNRDLRLRLQETDTAVAGVIGSRAIPLPAGFLEPLALLQELSSGRHELVFVPDKMDTSSAPGQPNWWTVDGANIAFERPCDQAYAYTLKMIQGFNLATPTACASWLLATYPDIYLAAGNVEAAQWLEDDSQAVRWQARYADALGSINAKEARSRSLAALRVDPGLQRASIRRGGFDISRGY